MPYWMTLITPFCITTLCAHVSNILMGFGAHTIFWCYTETHNQTQTPIPIYTLCHTLDAHRPVRSHTRKPPSKKPLAKAMMRCCSFYTFYPIIICMICEILRINYFTWFHKCARPVTILPGCASVSVCGVLAGWCPTRRIVATCCYPQGTLDPGFLSPQPCYLTTGTTQERRTLHGSPTPTNFVCI